jgi:Cu/Ag efflux protein CusF
MKRTLSGIALAGYALAISACSATKPVPPPPPPTVAQASSQGQGSGTREQVTTVTAAVEHINHKTREVTLKGPDGKTTTLHVSDDVKNLAQVHKGDWVTMSFYQAIAYQVKKKGTAKPGVSQAADVGTAPLGAKPGLVGGTAVTVTATIVSIDKATDTVRLKGPKGKMVSVKVQDPSRLEGVKAGDLVEITYTEALAISVEKAPKPSKKKS